MATNKKSSKNLFTGYLKESGEVGYVEKVVSSIIQVVGLPSVKLGEMVLLESGQLGQVMCLRPDQVEVLVFDKEAIRVATRVTRLKRKLSVPVGDWLLGNMIDVLGRPILGKPDNTTSEWRPVDISSSGIGSRVRVDKPFVTGTMMVDLLVPMGKGQRELVLGDRKTGKSYFLNQTVMSQSKEDNLCVYAAVGKQKTEIRKVREFLVKNGIAGKTVVVAASSQDSAGEIYLCPYTAMTIAEYFRDKGHDVFVVLDDMSTHAKFYRELSLLSHKFPGRDSYPGDIFHVHSKLLERSGYFKVGEKAVAITCMPVIETVQGDLSGYIQTNMMSMTDGHIYFDSDLYFRGRRPAINPFVSVTRVGRQTQTPLRRDAGRTLLDLLNSYEKTQSFLKFGAELGESSRQILAMGDKILKFLDQPIHVVIPLNVQLVLLALLITGVWGGEHSERLVEAYNNDSVSRKNVDDVVGRNDAMVKLMEDVRKSADLWLTKLVV